MTSKVAHRFGCAKQSKNLERCLIKIASGTPSMDIVFPLGLAVTVVIK